MKALFAIVAILLLATAFMGCIELGPPAEDGYGLDEGDTDIPTPPADLLDGDDGDTGPPVMPF